MTSPAPAATLASIRELASTDPKTLHQGHTALMGIYSLAELLGEDQIAKIAQTAAWGDQRVKTLPQAKEKLDAILALTPAAPTVGASAGDTILDRSTGRPKNFEDAVERLNAINKAAHADRRSSVRAALGWSSTTATSAPAAALPDTLIYEKYEGLKGAERQAFFSANRETLVREHGRRANAATQTVHADLVDRYMSLTGAARAAFFAEHRRELFAAHRARNKR